MKKISIIVPMYNVEDYIRKCLDSITKQTIFEVLEVIVIDDGSKDMSRKIAEEYSKQYSNIKVFSKENGGVSSARNFGIEKSTGDYVTFIDADDFINLSYMERFYNLIIQTNADIIIQDYTLIFDDGKKIKYRKGCNKKEWSREEAIKELLCGGDIGNNLFDKIFKYEIVKNIRFNKNIKIGEDFLFIYEALKKSNRIYGEFFAGYNYYQRNGSAMKSEFSVKQFDILEVSDIICDDINQNFKYLNEYAESSKVYTCYKVLERFYKCKKNDKKIFKEKVQKCKKIVNCYNIKKARKNFSKKRFLGFLLMRISPNMYMIICKIKRI